jgi:hypothetical protein
VVNLCGRGDAEQDTQAAMDSGCGGAEGGELGRTEAVDEAVVAGAFPAGGSARACALAAVEAAAPVGHGRLAAGAADPRPGAAARRGQEVATGIAIVEAAAAEQHASAGASAFALRASADTVGG